MLNVSLNILMRIPRIKGNPVPTTAKRIHLFLIFLYSSALTPSNISGLLFRLDTSFTFFRTQLTSLLYTNNFVHT